MGNFPPLPPELEDVGALPNALVRKVVQRALRLAGVETALGLYVTHVRWRAFRGLPFLSPEEAGLREANAQKGLSGTPSPGEEGDA